MRRCIKRLVCGVMFALVSAALFARPSIRDAVRSMDDALMKNYSTTAQVTLGFITYADTNTCGTVVPFMREAIQAAAADSRRINIIKTTELSEYEQSGIATRGLTMGMSKNARTSGEKKYILDGTYREKGADVELTLTLHDADGNVISVQQAYFAQSELTTRNLTLFPQNKMLAKTIQDDFDHAADETKPMQPSTASAQKTAATIGLSAAMLDMRGNLVNILHPNDTVRFKISADTDCYLAILCIDANGVKTWLSVTDSFLEADSPRLFPDIAGAVLRVADDGVFGAEQVVIYACTDKAGLPTQQSGDKYTSDDLHAIMRKQKVVRKHADYGTGTFKITYTIMERTK